MIDISKYNELLDAADRLEMEARKLRRAAQELIKTTCPVVGETGTVVCGDAT